MRTLGASVGVVTLTVLGILGCNGKLEVGEGSHGEPVSEGESESTQGVGGGNGSGGAGGTGGVGPAAATGSAGASGNVSCGVAGAGAGPSVQNSAWVDEVTPTPAVPGSSEGCPPGPQHPEAECETDGLTCEYSWPSTPGQVQEQLCYCTRSLGAGPVWKCFNGMSDPSCPAAMPEDGSDCYGYFDLGCAYPKDRECYCDSVDQTWACTTPPVADEAPGPPETIDPERVVAELTAEERETWCEWYSTLVAGGPGHAPIADRPVAGGCATGTACAFNETFCDAALPSLSVAQCIANLSLSECESPVSHLTGCVTDMVDAQCGPFEYDCLDYLETPNCDGSIILLAPDGGGGCSVRVE